jgi:peptidyl-prolyl cis-trans isomerase C
MKKSIPALRGAAIACLLPAIASAAPEPAKPSEPTAPVAEEKAPAAPTEKKAPAAVIELANVDGTSITTADVERGLRMRFGPQIDAMPAEQREMVMKQSIPRMAEELIARTLLLNAAKAAKTEADPAELAKNLAQVKGSIPPEMTFADYAKSIGHTEESFTAEITDEMRIGALVKAKIDALPKTSDDEIAKFYEENKKNFAGKEDVTASHILLKTDPAASDEAKTAKKAEIEKLRATLLKAKGEGFAELAKEHSDCPSGASGGDLGKFGRGQMVPAFEKAAFTQKEGEIGEIIETQFGFHLIKVTAKTDPGQRSLEDVREEIVTQLEGPRQQETVREYIDGLEKAAKITRSEALTPPAPPTPPAAPAHATPAAPATPAPAE